MTNYEAVIARANYEAVTARANYEAVIARAAGPWQSAAVKPRRVRV